MIVKHREKWREGEKEKKFVKDQPFKTKIEH